MCYCVDGVYSAARRKATRCPAAYTVLTAQVSTAHLISHDYHMTWNQYDDITARTCRDLPQLVQGLGAVLNDANKMVLFHHICQLLPEEAQTEFDRIAAGMLAGGKL